MDIVVKAQVEGKFKAVAGLRLNRARINGDVVNLDDPFEQKAAIDTMGNGFRRFAVVGTGLFKDAASDQLMRERFFDGAVRQYEILIPWIGVVVGPHQITSLEFEGEHNGEVTYRVALDSCGEIDFRPPAVTPDKG